MKEGHWFWWLQWILRDFQLGNEFVSGSGAPEVPDHQCQAPTGVMSQESYYFTDLQKF